MSHISNSSSQCCPPPSGTGTVIGPSNLDTTRDAFTRLRVSEPFTIFDAQNRYRLNSKFFSNVSGNASVTYLSSESSALLSTGANGAAIRQTKQVFAYQPGKSLLAMLTFVVVAGTGTHRVGFFNEYDGVFFEYSESVPKFVKRNQSSDTAVPKSQWSVDKLDGTGPSKLVLDTSKAQVLWFDLEWLGVGSVRAGFIINGQMIPCHVWNHANYVTSVYMTTAILPVRYEVSGSNATLKEICASIISEGGYEPTPALSYVANRGTTNANLINLGAAGTVVPLISLRLKSTRLYGYAVVKQIEVFNSSSSDGIQWYLNYGSTLVTPTWVAHPYSDLVESDTSSASMSGGQTITNGFADRSGRVAFDVVASEVRIGQSDIGTSEVITLAAAGFANNLSVAARIVWYEL